MNSYAQAGSIPCRRLADLVISSETIRLFAIEEGTSPFTIRTASPSRMAVLPTPASPISIGLFLRRRDKICRVWRISSSRPITGSSKFCLASLVKSMPYLSRNSPSGIEEGSRKMLPNGWEKKRTGTLLTGLGLGMAGSRRAAIRDARASVAILLRLGGLGDEAPALAGPKQLSLSRAVA